jgi:hypothetical protein
MLMFNIRRMSLRPRLRLSDAINKIERVDATGVRMAGGARGRFSEVRWAGSPCPSPTNIFPFGVK